MVYGVSCRSRVENRLKQVCVPSRSDFSRYRPKQKPVQLVFNRSSLPVLFVRLHNVDKTVCGEVFFTEYCMQEQLFQHSLLLT